jgi:hypothetical protein
MSRARTPASVIVSAALGVAVAIGIAVAFVALSNRSGEIELADRVFTVGRAASLAESIERDGPLLFPDPLRRSAGRNLFVQHLGDDPDGGWLAFEAQVDDPNCQVEWDSRERQFTDPCTGETFPADGGGLRHYPAKVDDGRLVVDLRTGETEPD